MLFCWLMFFHAAPGVLHLYLDKINPEDYTEKDAFMNAQGMTVYYWTLVLGQIAAAISTTTRLQSVFGLCGKPYGFPNSTLNWMFVGEIALGLAAVYWAPMQSLFETAWLPMRAALEPISALVAICFIEEIRKLIGRKRDEAADRKAERSAS